METARISEISGTAPIQPERASASDVGMYSCAISAALFANGDFLYLRDRSDVFALVLAGYQGLYFGDDGTFTGYVASELPLDDHEALDRVTDCVDRAVRELNPAYCAEFIGSIGVDEAGVLLEHATKQRLDVPQSDTVSWATGSLHT